MILFDRWYHLGGSDEGVFFKPRWLKGEDVLGTTAVITPKDTLGSISYTDTVLSLSEVLKIVENPVKGVAFIVSPPGHGEALLELLKDYANPKRLTTESVSEAVLFHVVNNTRDVHFLSVEGLERLRETEGTDVSYGWVVDRLVEAVKIPTNHRNQLSEIEAKALAIVKASGTLILPVVMPVMTDRELLTVYQSKVPQEIEPYSELVSSLWRGGVSF